jgi:hypothetical protein
MSYATWTLVLRWTAPRFGVGPELEFELDLDFPYLEISLLAGLEAMWNLKGRYPTAMESLGEP